MDYKDGDILSYKGEECILRITYEDDIPYYSIYGKDGQVILENISPENFSTLINSFDIKKVDSITDKNKVNEKDYYSNDNRRDTPKSDNSKPDRNIKDSTKNDTAAKDLSNSIGSVTMTRKTIADCKDMIDKSMEALTTANIVVNTWEEAKNASGLATEASIVFVNSLIGAMNTIKSNLQNTEEASEALNSLNVSLTDLLIRFSEKKEREDKLKDKQNELAHTDKEIPDGVDRYGRPKTKPNPRYKELEKEIDTLKQEIALLETQISELQATIDAKYENIREKYGNLINLDKALSNFKLGDGNVFGTVLPDISSLSLDAGGNFTFKEMFYEASNGEKLKYYLYLPEGVENTPGLPVHIYLHGTGEFTSSTTTTGLPYLLENGAVKPNAIVICPQGNYTSSKDKHWDKPKYEEALIELTDSVVSTYNADKKRISLSGHSQGAIDGYGIVKNHPGYFSAFVPIAGHNKNTSFSAVEHLGNTDVWAIVGSNDNKILSKARSTESEYLSRGGDSSLYALTVVPGQGHAGIQKYAFQNTFDNHGVEQNPLIWALSQTNL